MNEGKREDSKVCVTEGRLNANDSLSGDVKHHLTMLCNRKFQMVIRYHHQLNRRMAVHEQPHPATNSVVKSEENFIKRPTNDGHTFAVISVFTNNPTEFPKSEKSI